MKVKVDKEKYYKATFQHDGDKEDGFSEIVLGRKIYRLMNMARDLGYFIVDYEEA